MLYRKIVTQFKIVYFEIIQIFLYTSIFLTIKLCIFIDLIVVLISNDIEIANNLYLSLKKTNSTIDISRNLHQQTIYDISIKFTREFLNRIYTENINYSTPVHTVLTIFTHYLNLSIWTLQFAFFSHIILIQR